MWVVSEENQALQSVGLGEHFARYPFSFDPEFVDKSVYGPDDGPVNHLVASRFPGVVSDSFGKQPELGNGIHAPIRGERRLEISAPIRNRERQPILFRVPQTHDEELYSGGGATTSAAPRACGAQFSAMIELAPNGVPGGVCQSGQGTFDSGCLCQSGFWHNHIRHIAHMIAFSAHFDGKVIVPEHAVDLPRDRPFVVHVETSGSADLAGEKPPVHALQWLAENAVDDDLPNDLAAQHDHYLYGTPKRG